MIFNSVNDFIQAVIDGRNEIDIQDYFDETFKKGGLARLVQLDAMLFVKSMTNKESDNISKALALLGSYINERKSDNPYLFNEDTPTANLLNKLTGTIRCEKLENILSFNDYQQLLSVGYFDNPYFRQIKSKNKCIGINKNHGKDELELLLYGYMYECDSNKPEFRTLARLATHEFNKSESLKLIEFLKKSFIKYWQKRDSEEELKDWEQEISPKRLANWRKSPMLLYIIDELTVNIMKPEEHFHLNSDFENFITKRSQGVLNNDELDPFIQECCENHCLSDLLQNIFSQIKTGIDYNYDGYIYEFTNYNYINYLFGLAKHIDSFFSRRYNIAKVLPDQDIILFEEISNFWEYIPEVCTNKQEYSDVKDKVRLLLDKFTKYIQQIVLFEQRTQSKKTTSNESFSEIGNDSDNFYSHNIEKDYNTKTITAWLNKAAGKNYVTKNTDSYSWDPKVNVLSKADFSYLMMKIANKARWNTSDTKIDEIPAEWIDAKFGTKSISQTKSKWYKNGKRPSKSNDIDELFGEGGEKKVDLSGIKVDLP